MTKGTTPHRPSPAFRLGVVGNRNLQDADRAILAETAQRFLRMLDGAISEVAAEARGSGDPGPYSPNQATLFVVDSLAEGADQLVADAASESGLRYRLRIPIPFPMDEYTSFFSFERSDSIATFDRIARDQRHDPIVVELGGSGQGDRSDDYAAAADVLLDNCDLLLAVYDPTAVGREGGTLDTVDKAAAVGLHVVGIDLHRPDRLMLVSGANGPRDPSELTPDLLRRLVRSVLIPPSTEGLRRFLREPLLTGFGFARTLYLLMSRAYGLFWSVIPWIGSVVSALRSPKHHGASDRPPLPNREDPGAAEIIDEIQRPYLDRRAPIDLLARFYMNLYRGSFVINFVTGALAVLFGLLSYFHHARTPVWIVAEIVALVIIFGNFIGARVGDWHGRALDYRFIAEYLRHIAVLAPFGRSAPLVRPAAQYRGSDPIDTWMGWYVRAVDRDQGMMDVQRTESPTVMQIDEALVETMRARLCREWLLGQIDYYRKVEQRFDGALAAIRALMLLLFVVIVTGVIAHGMHLAVPLDPALWKEDAVLTIIVVALPAFLGALHGIAVQGELEKIADRAAHMSAYLAEVLEKISRPSTDVGAGATKLSVQAMGAARMMLGEVLDWRIIHQAHEVELT